MQDAVASTDGGVLLNVEITPSADRDAFPAGYNPWRDRIQARVKAPAQDGRANQALCEIVAEHLGVAGSAVHIKHGATSRKKTLLVQGTDLETVRAALEDVLDA